MSLSDRRVQQIDNLAVTWARWSNRFNVVLFGLFGVFVMVAGMNMIWKSVRFGDSYQMDKAKKFRRDGSLAIMVGTLVLVFSWFKYQWSERSNIGAVAMAF
jgi:hypothetical protein